MTNFSSEIFNNQLKSLVRDGYLFTFRHVILDSLLNHNKSQKGYAGEVNMITFALLQYAGILCVSSDPLKEWVSK